MLTQAQNEMLTRTGPGTAMGALFRRFWVPVLRTCSCRLKQGAEGIEVAL